MEWTGGGLKMRRNYILGEFGGTKKMFLKVLKEGQLGKMERIFNFHFGRSSFVKIPSVLCHLLGD